MSDKPRTYWATLFADDLVLIRKVEAFSHGAAKDLVDRYAEAASRSTGQVYQVLDVFDEYPASYVLNEVQVSDLEFLVHKMRRKEDHG